MDRCSRWGSWAQGDSRARGVNPPAIANCAARAGNACRAACRLTRQLALHLCAQCAAQARIPASTKHSAFKSSSRPSMVCLGGTRRHFSFECTACRFRFSATYALSSPERKRNSRTQSFVECHCDGLALAARNSCGGSSSESARSAEAASQGRYTSAIDQVQFLIAYILNCLWVSCGRCALCPAPRAPRKALRRIFAWRAERRASAAPTCSITAASTILQLTDSPVRT